MSAQDTATEINFDGIVGPTYNYSKHAAGSPGNLASAASKGRRSNPRAAALEGLRKAELVMELGVEQAVLPPLVRPKLEPLYQLGLMTEEELSRADDLDALAKCLAKVAGKAPDLLARCYSASSVWTANWATVSPSADTQDKKFHITPANMSSSFHRSLEGEEAGQVLKQIFGDEKHFIVHDRLPRNQVFGDEGAANHLRLSPTYGAKGINVFVYGRDGFKDAEPGRRYFARQTREASEALVRLHALEEDFTIFARQSAAAVDAGVFHNDVICGSNLNLLFYHERAFEDIDRVMCELNEKYLLCRAESADGGAADLQGAGELQLVEVREDDVSLDQLVTSYLFNSQIVKDSNGRTVLISPHECEVIPSVRRFLKKLMSGDDAPFDEIKYVDVASSMRSGGGPACLRLRAVLTAEQRRALGGSVLLNKEKLIELRELVESTYPTIVTDALFSQVDFLEKCMAITARLYRILGLTPAELR